MILLKLIKLSFSSVSCISIASIVLLVRIWLSNGLLLTYVINPNGDELTGIVINVSLVPKFLLENDDIANCDEWIETVFIPKRFNG